METAQKTTKRALKDLNPGDVVVVPFTRVPPRTVRRVDQARARGYVVVSFTDADQTSGHKDNLVDVAVPQ